MEPIEFLVALRRRWWIIVLLTVCGIAGGSLALQFVDRPAAPRRFEAHAILLKDAASLSIPGSVNNPETAAALATLNPVPADVAQEIGYEGTVQDLVDQVTATIDTDTSLLTISAIADRPDEAKTIANAFARELVDSLSQRQHEAIDTQLSGLRGLLRDVRKRIQDVRVTASPTLAALLATSDNLQIRYQELVTLRPAPGLRVIEPAVRAISLSPPPTETRSWTTGAIAGGLVGLALGLALALFLERIDTRIRTKEAAERSFEAPVLAEIPRIPRKARAHPVAAAAPWSHAAEAFRQLSAELTRGIAAASGNGHAASPPARPPTTILVTSPGPGEGKTTVTANLATAFGEVGKRVVVMSCDFRRPAIHRYFGVDNSTGLTEELAHANGSSLLEPSLATTPFDRVRVAPSGPAADYPGELLNSQAMRRAIAEAREAADIVLIDSAPILTVSDAAYLIPEVDAVLIVARARRTTTRVARQTTERLRRLSAPVAGVALNDAGEIEVPRGYTDYLRPIEADVVEQDLEEGSEPRPTTDGVGVSPTLRVTDPGEKL